VCHEVLALCWRVGAKAYQHHIINWHLKHDYHLGPVGNGDEIPVLFDILMNTAIYTEGGKSVLA